MQKNSHHGAESINNYFEGIIKALTTSLDERGLEGLAEELSTQLGQIISKAIEQLPKVADFGAKIVKKLTEAIKDNSKGIGKGIGELVSTMIQSFFDILPDVVDIAITVVATFIKTIRREFGNNNPCNS